MQIEYQINSDVLKKIIQESVDNKKQLYFVYDRDRDGGIINVGYFFKDKKDETTEVTWFNKSEILIRKIPDEIRTNNPFRGKLQINFNHPKISERNFLINVPIDLKLSLLFRCIYRDKTSINNFVIQVELEKSSGKEKNRKPLVRYDCAHGYLHRDLITNRNQQIKEKITTFNKNNPIRQIIDEIPEKINKWLKRLGYSEIDTYKIKNTVVLEELKKAGIKIEKLLDKPEKIAFTESNLIAFAE